VYETVRLIVSSFVLPPGGPITLAVLGVLAWRRSPRLGSMLAIFGVASLWAASLPIVANALVTALGGARPLDPAAASGADAIVILGGGVRSQAPEYGGDTLGRLTLERVRYGARLARQTGLPVLVTGGAPAADVRPEAELMREALEREFCVGVRWADDRARNTRENAINAARLLAADGRRRIVLVMHGFDVRRATREFQSAGLEVVSAPTQVPNWDGVGLADFLPNVGALHTAHYAAYELVALARIRLVAATSRVIEGVR